MAPRPLFILIIILFLFVAVIFASARLVRRSDGALWLVSTSVDHPDCPPVRGRVRAEVRCAAALIQPLSAPKADTCQVTWLMGMDYKGLILATFAPSLCPHRSTTDRFE